jgi:uncharacterized protein YbjQ (UPF0145 family)
MKTIAFIAMPVAIFLAGCATCTHHLTGTERSPVPAEAVYVYPAMPKHAEIIASLSANSYAGITLKQANEDALDQLKSEAGKLGANGIVLRGANEDELTGANLRANAFYVAPDLTFEGNRSVEGQDASWQR